MEQQKIIDELAEIQIRIAGYLEILGSDKVLRDLIIKELREVQKDYGDDRRTEIIEDTGEILLEDLVAVEDVAITVTRGGYLKRTSVDTYRRQTRGGKGRIGMGTRAEDFVERLLVASTHSYLLIFTTRGRVYWLKAYEIPDASTIGKGKHISNLINLQPDETPKAFLSVKEFVADQYIVMVTKHGVIKKSDGDELIAARITNGKNFIFLGSREGQAIKFNEDDVRPMGRQARGVRAMNLSPNDEIIGAEVVEADGLILSIAEHGFGKRTPLEDYRLTGRGGKGVINMKTTKKTGNVVAILSVKEDSDLMIVSQNGKMIRIESGTIRQAGRSTQGVKLVSLEEGDLVAAAGVIPEADESPEGNLPLEPGPVQ
jgi:DNA gyrase subunit A